MHVLTTKFDQIIEAGIGQLKMGFFSEYIKEESKKATPSRSALSVTRVPPENIWQHEFLPMHAGIQLQS
jgi:hypothetical protein